MQLNLDTDLIPFSKIASWCIINLNVKSKVVKLLEENTGENQGDLGFSGEFLDAAPKAQFMKGNIMILWLYFIKIENFPLKDSIGSMREQAISWRNIYKT